MAGAGRLAAQPPAPPSVLALTRSHLYPKKFFMERVRELALFGENAFTDNRMFEFNVQRA